MTGTIDRDGVILIVVLIGFAIAVALLFELLRMYFENKLSQLNQATKALRDHFDIVDQILASEKVSRPTKQIIVRLSHIVCDREAADSIAASIIHKRVTELNPVQESAFKLLFDEIRQLMAAQSPLAMSINAAIELAFASMIIRWPEAQVALPAVAVLDAGSGGTSIREKVRRMLSAMPASYFGPVSDGGGSSQADRQMQWATR
jgi:hypothetical protein